jgi:uncharacterized protein GlcG (DUF336 family)
VILALDTARRIAERAIEKVTQVAVPYTIAILDGSANLILLTRTDGGRVASIDTSSPRQGPRLFFGAATEDLAGLVTSGQPPATIETAISATLAFVSGGAPIQDPKGVICSKLSM